MDDFSFQLTKLLGGLVMPLPTILCLLVLGLVLLYIKRARRFSLFLLTFATLYLFVASTGSWSRNGVVSLENDYPMLKDPPKAADWVVVLGGGVHDDPSLPPVARLAGSSKARLLEGLRIYRQLPHAKLILSGGFPNVKPDSITTADAMANVAVRWGIPETDIVLDRYADNTEAEAKAVAKRVKPDQLVIVVTSAVHMPRALALFDEQRISAVPAPTRPSVTKKKPKHENWGHYVPQASNVALAERSLKEVVGYWWARLRGEAAPPRGKD